MVEIYSTQSPLSITIHLPCHLQSLCGGDVNVAWNHHQADGFLCIDELLDQFLNLKISIHIWYTFCWLLHSNVLNP